MTDMVGIETKKRKINGVIFPIKISKQFKKSHMTKIVKYFNKRRHTEMLYFSTIGKHLHVLNLMIIILPIIPAFLKYVNRLENRLSMIPFFLLLE